MKVKCPVAGCDYIIKGADDGFKHWQNYDEFHKQLHRNWLNYFYPNLANSDWSDEVKYRFAYKEWHKQEKDQIKQQKKGKDGKGSGTGQNIEIRDGKYIVDGVPYTADEFANMQKGIRYMPVEMKK